MAHKYEIINSACDCRVWIVRPSCGLHNDFCFASSWDALNKFNELNKTDYKTIVEAIHE